MSYLQRYSRWAFQYYWRWHDGLLDYEGPWVDGLLYTMEWCKPYLLCPFGTHEAIDDHCGMPEHRLCWRCQTPMPHAPLLPTHH